MKIAVYLVAKNEAKFIERCVRSASAADLVLVADTGSSDGTQALAEAAGAKTVDICISPWRFDDARNAALAAVPKDIDVCVSLDADEILCEGWREEIEALWGDSVTRMRYMFDWGSGISFHSDKFHARNAYRWVKPCHEVLVIDARMKEQMRTTDKLLVKHLPDNLKSRSNYLPLLHLAHKEHPDDLRALLYYARELSFYKNYQEAIPLLEKYVASQTSSEYERGFALRHLGKCYMTIGNISRAFDALRRACLVSPQVRCGHFALAKACYERGRWAECLSAAFDCLAIDKKSHLYTEDPEAWGHLIYDYAAIASFNLGIKTKAIAYGERAIELSPEDPRLRTNLDFYQQMKAA